METKKLTGVALIAAERQEQIEKHHHTIEDDVNYNKDCKLSFASSLLNCPDPDKFAKAGHNFGCPTGWNPATWKKMIDKTYKQRLIISGALIAAEIDRIQAIE